MAGNVQKFGFFKNPLSESGSWSTWFWFKNVYFWSEFFFQMLLENFLCVVWSCSIYLEVCARPYVYARKKIRVIRHTYQKIQTKTRFKSEKNPVQNSFPSDHCSKYNSKEHKNKGRFPKKSINNMRTQIQYIISRKSPTVSM